MQIMLATDLCRFIMREHPEPLLANLQQWSSRSDEIIISSITYAELVAAAMLTRDQPRHMQLVKEFCERLDEIVAWDAGAVDAYSAIQIRAMQQGVNLNMNDAMLAAHALSLKARLLTLGSGNFVHIEGLDLQVWQNSEG
jgi:tRNA(fMet)-specific endonuclease VapC